MNAINHLKNAYNYAEMYKRQYIGGVVPSWKTYLKNGRAYRGETMREFMIRMSHRYDGDIRNDKLLDKLELIQQNILKLIDKITVGIPVPISSIQRPTETLANLPPPPPPMPPKQKPKPTAKELEQMSTREKLMAELAEKLAKRGMVQASGGKRRRRRRL